MDAYNRYQDLRRRLDAAKLAKHVARKFEGASESELRRWDFTIDELRQKISSVRNEPDFKRGMEASRPKLNLSKRDERELRDLKDAIKDLKNAVAEHEAEGDQDRADWFRRFLDECMIRKDEIYAGDR